MPVTVIKTLCWPARPLVRCSIPQQQGYGPFALYHFPESVHVESNTQSKARSNKECISAMARMLKLLNLVLLGNPARGDPSLS